MDTPSHSAQMGTLYIVPTPIGNIDDLSPRARQILSTVTLIAAEDTRTSAHLLRSLDIQTKCVSYHDHNENQRAPSLLKQLQAGDSIALISDAGTPLVSDPGYILVCGAIDAQIPVVPIPGPCAAITALSASGLPPARFIFSGFLPRQKGRRESALKVMSDLTETLIFYEAPHRIRDTLGSIQDVLGDRRVCLACSVTKKWERFYRGTPTEVLDDLEAPDALKGEMTLIVEGKDPSSSSLEENGLDPLIQGLVREGLSPSRIRDLLSTSFDVSKRDVYQRALHLAQEE